MELVLFVIREACYFLYLVSSLVLASRLRPLDLPLAS